MPARLGVTLTILSTLIVGSSSMNRVVVAQTTAFQSPRQCGGEVGLSSKFGRPVAVDFVLSGTNPRSTNFLPSDGTRPRALRLALRAEATANSRWVLNVRDSGLRLLASYSAADFAASGGQIWTGRFAVSNVAVELLNAAGADRITIEKAILYDDPGGAGSLFSTAVEGVPNWKALADRRQWAEARLGDTVGMMVANALTSSGSSQSWCCSGVMVTPTLYLTNWHCGGTAPAPGALLWGEDMRETALIDLGWDEGARNRQYRAKEVVAQSEALDFALVRVVATRGEGGDYIPVEPAKLGARLPPSGSGLKIIHHPTCLPKQISFVNCKVGDRRDAWRVRPDGSRPASDFTHTCDTEAGSSGGPVFDGQGDVVGIHHLGYELGPQCAAVRKENRAVAIDAILDEVARVAPSAHTEILRAQNR